MLSWEKQVYVKSAKFWGIQAAQALIFKAKYFPFINPAGLF